MRSWSCFSESLSLERKALRGDLIAQWMSSFRRSNLSEWVEFPPLLNSFSSLVLDHSPLRLPLFNVSSTSVLFFTHGDSPIDRSAYWLPAFGWGMGTSISLPFLTAFLCCLKPSRSCWQSGKSPRSLGCSVLSPSSKPSPFTYVLNQQHEISVTESALPWDRDWTNISHQCYLLSL